MTKLLTLSSKAEPVPLPLAHLILVEGFACPHHPRSYVTLGVWCGQGAEVVAVQCPGDKCAYSNKFQTVKKKVCSEFQKIIHSWPLCKVYVPGNRFDPILPPKLLNSSRYSFNNMLETVLKEFGPYGRFIGCIFLMWISCLTTSKRCSIRLRSDHCRWHLSTLKSLSWSRNQFEMIWPL